MNKSIHLLFAAMLGITWSMTTLADEHHDHRGGDRGFSQRHFSAPAPRVHMQIDAHFGHNRYYPRPGVGYRALPSGYYTTHFHGSPYYFREGIWYRRGG